MSHKYYSITLVPRTVTEDGFKIGYGAPKVDIIELPMLIEERIVCVPETNYGHGMFPIESDFQLCFHRLRISQLDTILDKYNEIITSLMAGGVEEAEELLKSSKNLTELAQDLVHLECETPSTDTATLVPPNPEGLATDVVRQIVAKQEWPENERGGHSPSGWFTEDESGVRSPIPENSVLVEYTDSVEKGGADLPTAAIFKLI